MAIIRQQYIDPKDKLYKTREITIDLDIVRPDDSISANSVARLIVAPVHLPHIHDAVVFDPIAKSPDEVLAILLDGKRTTPPVKCWRTRIVKQPSSSSIIVEDATHLHPNVGDPVVILSSLNKNNTKHFGLIESINENEIKISNEMPKFYHGAIIQNLANRWHEYDDINGAKTQLKRPHPLTFGVKLDGDQAHFKISVPVNPGTAKYYDVYVRNHPIESFEPHWIADSNDIPLANPSIKVKTYNGGPNAGGGYIKDCSNQMYCFVVCKDGSGFYGVNESTFSPKLLA